MGNTCQGIAAMNEARSNMQASAPSTGFRTRYPNPNPNPNSNPNPNPSFNLYPNPNYLITNSLPTSLGLAVYGLSSALCNAHCSKTIYVHEFCMPLALFVVMIVISCSDMNIFLFAMTFCFHLFLLKYISEYGNYVCFLNT